MAKLSVKPLMLFSKDKKEKATHLLRGEHAERYAEKHLKKLGLKFVERNYHCRQGEIDLIFYDHDVLVFVEVRSRSNTRFGAPEETIDVSKQAKCRKAAEHYLFSKKIDNVPCRFDVVTLVPRGRDWELNYYKNAF